MWYEKGGIIKKMKIHMVFTILEEHEIERAKDLVWYFDEFINEVVGLELSIDSVEFIDAEREIKT